MPTLILNLHTWVPSSHHPPPDTSQDSPFRVTLSHLLHMQEESSPGA